MDITHIKDLLPDPRNARKHTPRNVGMITEALHEVGAARSIVIDEHGQVLAGNATIEAAGIAGIERVQVIDADGDTIIAVRRSGLTARQKQRLALYDNRAAELADWELPILLEEPELLAGMFYEDEIAALMATLVEPASAGMLTEPATRGEEYSRKIKSPLYAPSEDTPAVTALFDDRKTQALLAAIAAAPDLSSAEREFLTIAARRHTVLHYNKIADYYAAAPAPLQRLMEDSALVIIDFNRAIELGFVQLSAEIAAQYALDYPDE